MLLTAPDIAEEISQDHIDSVVDRTLRLSTGGGDPPDIWEKGYGGDKPDGSGGRNDSLMYLVAWGCILSIWAVGIYKIVSAEINLPATITENAPPIALKAFNQNRPQLDLLLSNLNSPYLERGAVKSSSLKSCPVP